MLALPALTDAECEQVAERLSAARTRAEADRRDAKDLQGIFGELETALRQRRGGDRTGATPGTGLKR